MSFSFQVRGATKQEVMDLVTAKLTEICKIQADHKLDSGPVLGAVEEFVELLVDDPSKDIQVAVRGSLWNSTVGIVQTGVGIDAQLVTKVSPLQP